MNKKTSNKQQWLSVLSLVSVVALSGCVDRSYADLDAFFATVSRQSAPPVEPLPEIAPYMTYAFNDSGRDPFDETVLLSKKARKKSAVQLDENHVPEFLESFSLESVSMVGAVEKANRVWALVKIPSGEIHKITVGEYMGLNQGKVTEVTEAAVTLSEIVPDGYGGYKKVNTKLSAIEQE